MIEREELTYGISKEFLTYKYPEHVKKFDRIFPFIYRITNDRILKPDKGLKSDKDSIGFKSGYTDEIIINLIISIVGSIVATYIYNALKKRFRYIKSKQIDIIQKYYLAANSLKSSWDQSLQTSN